MIDWKKIRDKRNSLIQLELNNPQSLFATRQRRCFENYNFPLLIQALEEQEKRIEFLEKTLSQSAMLGDVTLNPILMVDGELQAEDDVQYLRADTCVSKEKLEELLNDWKVRYKFKPEADKTLADCIRELREVMK